MYAIVCQSNNLKVQSSGAVAIEASDSALNDPVVPNGPNLCLTLEFHALSESWFESFWNFQLVPCHFGLYFRYRWSVLPIEMHSLHSNRQTKNALYFPFLIIKCMPKWKQMFSKISFFSTCVHILYFREPLPLSWAYVASRCVQNASSLFRGITIVQHSCFFATNEQTFWPFPSTIDERLEEFRWQVVVQRGGHILQGTVFFRFNKETEGHQHVTLSFRTPCPSRH